MAGGNPVGGSQFSLNNVRGQIQTPLLTHCTNPRPLYFIGLDNSIRSSDMNVGILYGAGKAQAEIAASHAAQISIKFNQATDWPHLDFNVINILVRNQL